MQTIQQTDSSDPGHNATSRRSFLKRATVAAAVAAPALAVPASAARGENIIVEAEELLGLYHFSEIKKHENDHVAFLISALGSYARPEPTFKGLLQPDLQSFLTLSRAFENTGVGAYLGAAPAIYSKTYLAAAGSILTVEARHAGFIDTLTGQSITPGNVSFDSPLTAAQVAAAVSSFIVSLNGGPPVSYSTTPSPANDYAILNFALALEYLERDFYNANASKFHY